MSNRFEPGRLGDWVVFCDICGQKCYASEASKLTLYTGKGEMIVCPKDVDKVDYGLVPYKPRTEQNLPYTRINHTDTTDGSPFLDLEDMALCYDLSTEDGFIITTENSEDIQVCEKIS